VAARKFKMIKLVVSFSAIVLSILSIYIMEYIDGRFNTWLIIPPMLPAITLPLLIAFIGTIFFIIWLVKSVLNQNERVPAIILFVILSIFFVIFFKVPYSLVLKKGFTDYVKASMSSEDWQNLAIKSKEIIGTRNSLPGPGRKRIQNDTNVVKWSKLKSSTKIDKLGNSMQIVSRDSSVEIYWGSALVGHRSIVIYNDKMNRLNTGDIKVEDRIKICFSPD
jgi:hypothetical protein